MLFLFNAYKRGDEELLFGIKDTFGEDITEKDCIKIPKINTSIQQKFLWSFARQSSIHYPNVKNGLTDKQVDKMFENIKSINELEDNFNICKEKCKNGKPEDHINWWTEKKVIKFLEKAGFKMILKSRLGQSISPDMRNLDYFDNPLLSKYSLYVEGIKGHGTKTMI